MPFWGHAGAEPTGECAIASVARWQSIALRRRQLQGVQIHRAIEAAARHGVGQPCEDTGAVQIHVLRL